MKIVVKRYGGFKFFDTTHNLHTHNNFTKSKNNGYLKKE